VSDDHVRKPDGDASPLGGQSDPVKYHKLMRIDRGDVNQARTIAR